MPSPSSPPPAQGIFISYRRDDTAYAAGWLFDRLSDRFGAAQIFKDIDSIEPGDDFVDTISAAVASCDILLALIGDQWLTAAGPDGRRRLDDPNDFVRLEIEAALARDIRVIPVLVEDARMPSAGELPPSLAGLLRRQALELSPTRFAADLGRLVRVVEATLAPTGPDGRAAGSVARLRSLSGPRRVAAVVAAAIVVVILIVALAAGDGSSPADGGDTPSGEEPAPEEDSSGWALPLVMAAGPALGGRSGRRRPAPRPGAPLSQGPQRSLLAKLDAALAALDGGRAPAACNTLHAFAREVEALPDRHLPAATAEALVAEAESIGRQLGC